MCHCICEFRGFWIALLNFVASVVLALFVLFWTVTLLFLCSGRNDVWRYQGHPGIWMATWKAFSRGLWLAVGAMVVTIAADKMFGLKRDMHPPHLAHHHGHHEKSMHDWQIYCYVSCVVIAFCQFKTVCCDCLCRSHLNDTILTPLMLAWLFSEYDFFGSLNFVECWTLSVNCCWIKQVNTWIFILNTLCCTLHSVCMIAWIPKVDGVICCM